MRRVRDALAAPVALFAIGAVAAGVRVVFAIAHADALPAVDSDLYRELGRNLADGAGYVLPDSAGELVRTAQHPPAFPFLIAGLDVVGLTTELQQRVVLGVVAAVGVVLTGFVARHAVGPAAGVVAALIAALHPLWFQHAAFGVSESLYLVVVPLLLLLGLRAVDQPSTLRIALLGGAVGVAALTRSEGVLFFLALVVPLVIVACRTWKERLVAIVVAALAMGVVVAPWVVRNYQVFDGFTLSTNRGVTLAGSWCESTFSEYLGGWNLYCVLPAYDDVRAEPPPAGRESWDELAIDRELTSRSVEFAREHAGKVPQVVAARLGRTVGVYALGEQLDFDQAEGRVRSVQWIGQVVNLLLLLLAVIGATRVARRYLPVLLAGPVVALLVTIVFYGSTRMRVPAEPAIAVLAAAGVVALDRWTRGSRAGTPEPRDHEPRAADDEEVSAR